MPIESSISIIGDGIAFVAECSHLHIFTAEVASVPIEVGVWGGRFHQFADNYEFFTDSLIIICFKIMIN